MARQDVLEAACLAPDAVAGGGVRSGPVLAVIMLPRPHDRGYFRAISMIMARFEQILPLSGLDHGFRPLLARIMLPRAGGPGTRRRPRRPGRAGPPRGARGGVHGGLSAGRPPRAA